MIWHGTWNRWKRLLCLKDHGTVTTFYPHQLKKTQIYKRNLRWKQKQNIRPLFIRPSIPPPLPCTFEPKWYVLQTSGRINCLPFRRSGSRSQSSQYARGHAGWSSSHTLRGSIQPNPGKKSVRTNVWLFCIYVPYRPIFIWIWRVTGKTYRTHITR